MIRISKNERENLLVYTWKGGAGKKEIDSILFIEKIGREVAIHTVEGERIIVHGTLSEIRDMLNPYGFEFVNQSEIVNFNYVSNIEKWQIIFKDSENNMSEDLPEIYITRTKKQAVMRMFLGE